MIAIALIGLGHAQVDTAKLNSIRVEASFKDYSYPDRNNTLKGEIIFDVDEIEGDSVIIVTGACKFKGKGTKYFYSEKASYGMGIEEYNDFEDKFVSESIAGLFYSMIRDYAKDNENENIKAKIYNDEYRIRIGQQTYIITTPVKTTHWTRKKGE